MPRERKKRPGVMLYFETRHCIQRLDLEQRGSLLDAILDYAEYGCLPNFSEEDEIALCVAWDVLKPKIDADRDRYEEKCKSAQDAANERWGNT